MKKGYLFIIFIILCSIQVSRGQTKKIGNLITLSSIDKSTAFIINAENGDYNGMFKLNEDIFNTNSNKENNIGYALTRHKIYSINLKNAKIIDSLEVFKTKVKSKNDFVDPNLYFIPFYVSEKGIAYYGQMNINTSQYELYSCDINNKKITLILKRPLGHNFVFLDNEMIVFKDNSIIIRNPETQEVLNTFHNIIPDNQKENAKNLKISTHGDVVVLKFYPDAKNTYVFKYSRSNKSLIGNYVTTDQLTEDIDFKNCSSTHYVRTLCNYPSQPAAPTFPELKGFSKKKKAIWRAEVDKIQADFTLKNKEWFETVTKGDNCSIVFYSNQNFNEILIKIEKAKYGTLFNDQYLYINRIYEVELYDIINKKTIWVQDIDL